MNAFAEVVENHVFLNEIAAGKTEKGDPDDGGDAWKVETGNEYLIHGTAINEGDVELGACVTLVHVDLEEFATGGTSAETLVEGEEEQPDEVRRQDVP